VSALAGVVSASADAKVGRLFLAVPAIRLARLTLVAQKKGDRQGSRRGAQRGRRYDRDAHLENEIMYPEVRRLLPDLEQDVLESYEEHHVADVLCLELSTMDPGDEHFDAKVTVLIENVTHHVQEEEDEWFPKVREGLGRNQLQDLGAKELELRPKAPTKPTEPAALKKALDAVRA
jgi:hypothetical protein